jgi:hypothetical protein
MGNPTIDPGKPNKKSAEFKQKVGENQTKINLRNINIKSSTVVPCF